MIRNDFDLARAMFCGRVILDADRETPAIKNAMAITAQRRKNQQEYNEFHHITPRSIRREQIQSLEESFGLIAQVPAVEKKPISREHVDIADLERKIRDNKIEMERAAKELRFEDAARCRDLMRYYQSLELPKSDTD